MAERIVITGGAGFIGCALSRALVSGGDKVVAIDNLHPQIHGQATRPVALLPDVELIVADVCNGEFWDTFLSEYRPTTVVHLAAETGTAQSLLESTRHGHVNVIGTTQMLDAFGRAGFRPQHIVLTSSRAVYGEGAWSGKNGQIFYPEVRSHEQLSNALWDFTQDGEIARALPHRAKTIFPNPSSVYGATKLAQENILTAWTSAMNVPLSIFRLQNVYGPGQSPFNPYAGIINIFHRAAFSGGAINVYEDGLIGRDFVFIDDVANVLAKGIAQPPHTRRLLDVGSGRATTILEAARAIAALHNAPSPIISGQFRDGDVRWAVAQTDDLQRELSIKAEVDFIETGARLVGDWLIEKGYMA